MQINPYSLQGSQKAEERSRRRLKQIIITPWLH
jgi:hypothetical protein